MLTGALRLFTGGLAGKLLGVAREGLLAFLFGTSDVVAANRVAQTAVLSPLNIATTDALSGAYLPLQARLVQERSAVALALYRAVQVVLGGFGLLLLIGMVCARTDFVRLVAPDLSASTLGLATSMTVVIALGIPSYLHFGMLAYLEMAHDRYTLFSIRASGQSVGLILGTLVGFYTHRPSLLAWGFTAAYGLMSVLGMVHVRRRGYLVGDARPTAGQLWSSVQPFLRRMRLLLLIPVLTQAQVVTEKIVASGLGSSAVAAVDYARLVSDTVLLLLAVPIGLATLTTFAVMDPALVRTRLLALIRPFVLLAAGLSVLAFAFAQPFVRIVFQRGAFDAHSTAVTAAIFAGFAIGMWAVLVNFILLRICNALDRVPLSLLAVAVTTVLTIALRPVCVRRFGPLGLGLAVSIGAMAGAVVVMVAVGVAGRILLDLATLLPPAAATVAVGRWAASWPVGSQLSALGLSGLVWVAYLLLAPPSGPVVRTALGRIVARVRPARVEVGS